MGTNVVINGNYKLPHFSSEFQRYCAFEDNSQKPMNNTVIIRNLPEPTCTLDMNGNVNNSTIYKFIKIKNRLK